MSISVAKFALPMLIAMSGCRTAPSGSEVKMWRTYRVEIPHFVVEFLIPPELTRGYGPFRKEVSFEKPANPRFTFSFGNGAYRKEVGGFFLGVKGDFRDWDLTASVFVIKFDRGQRSMRSVEELAEFPRKFLAEKYLLADGKEVDDLGSITIEKIGSHDVVVATRADPHHVRIVKIKGGGEFTQSPYQLYYIWLNDEVTVGIRVSHDNEKKLNPKWYAESHARITKIIENLKVEAVASGSEK